jgi:hypothetical protein
MNKNSKKSDKKAKNVTTDFLTLFDQLGLSDLSVSEKEKRFAEMQEIVEMRVFSNVSSMLDEKSKKEWDKCKTDKELDAFYEKHGINLQTIAFAEAQAYREELLQEMAYLTAKLEK